MARTTKKLKELKDIPPIDPPKPVIMKMECKYEFSDAEKSELQSTLLLQLDEHDRLVIRKKAITTDLATRVKTSETDIGDTRTLLKDGYQMRMMDVRVEKDFDAGVKRFVRVDNGQTVDTVPLTPGDRQMDLPAAEEPKGWVEDESQFEKSTLKTFELWKADKDLGTLTIGRAGGQWYYGAQLAIGSRKGDMPLSPEGEAHKNRFDCVRHGAKAVLAWIKDVAPEFVEGFEPKIKEVVESQKEIVE